MWPALPTSCSRSRRRRRRRSCKTNNFGQKVQVLHVTICTKPRAEASPRAERETRHEEREMELEMEKRQPQLPSCNTNESKSFCCRSTASTVEGAQGAGRVADWRLPACCVASPDLTHRHTHTHTLPQRVARVVGRFVLGSQSQSQSRPGPGSVSGCGLDEGWLQLRLRLRLRLLLLLGAMAGLGLLAMAITSCQQLAPSAQ